MPSVEKPWMYEINVNIILFYSDKHIIFGYFYLFTI